MTAHRLPATDWPALLRCAPYFSRAIVDALCERGPDGFAPHIAAVYWFDLFDAQVSNGGVDQYFDNVLAQQDDADAVPALIAANPVYAPALALIEEAHAIWRDVAQAYPGEEDDDEEDDNDDEDDAWDAYQDLLAPHEDRLEAIATAFFALHHTLRQRLEQDIVQNPHRYFAIAPVPGLRGSGVEHIALADGAHRLRFEDGFPIGPNSFENEDGGCDVIWFSRDRALLQCETAGWAAQRDRHFIHYPSQGSSTWTSNADLGGKIRSIRSDQHALGGHRHGLHETFHPNGQRESAALHWHGQELCSEHFHEDGSPLLRIEPHGNGQQRWLRYWPGGALNTESLQDRDGRDRYLRCLDEHGTDLAPGGTGRLHEVLGQHGEIVQWREGELVAGFLHGPVRRMACRPDGSGTRETECTFYKNGRAQ